MWRKHVWHDFVLLFIPRFRHHNKSSSLWSTIEPPAESSPSSFQALSFLLKRKKVSWKIKFYLYSSHWEQRRENACVRVAQARNRFARKKGRVASPLQQVINQNAPDPPWVSVVSRLKLEKVRKQSSNPPLSHQHHGQPPLSLSISLSLFWGKLSFLNWPWGSFFKSFRSVKIKRCTRTF